MYQRLLVLFFFLFVFLCFPSTSEAQQGCCSHHGGISYCADNGRYVCNDGTYSPTCTCGGGTSSSRESAIQRIRETYNEPPTTYCGAGDIFYSYTAAQESLNTYKSEVEAPLNEEIRNLETTVSNLQGISIVVFLFMLIFMIYGYAWGNDKLRTLIKVTVYIAIFVVILFASTA